MVNFQEVIKKTFAVFPLPGIPTLIKRNQEQRLVPVEVYVKVLGIAHSLMFLIDHHYIFFSKSESMPAFRASIASWRPQCLNGILMTLRTKTAFGNEAIIINPPEELLWFFKNRNLFPWEMLSKNTLAIIAFPSNRIPEHESIVEMRLGHNLKTAMLTNVFAECCHAFVVRK